MGKQLLPGQTVKIRINPRDCMACIDIVQAIGLSTKHMSFAQVVRTALSSCAESMRQNQVIPSRDGFEYAEMMQPFADANRAEQLAVARLTTMAGPDGRRIAPVMPVTPELAQAKREMEQLAMRRDADPANWSKTDEDRWTELCGVVYG